MKYDADLPFTHICVSKYVFLKNLNKKRKFEIFNTVIATLMVVLVTMVLVVVAVIW